MNEYRVRTIYLGIRKLCGQSCIEVSQFLIFKTSVYKYLSLKEGRKATEKTNTKIFWLCTDLSHNVWVESCNCLLQVWQAQTKIHCFKHSNTHMYITELFIIKRNTFKLRCKLFTLLNATFPQLQFTRYHTSHTVHIVVLPRMLNTVYLENLAVLQCNHQIKIRQNFLLTYACMAIPYWTAKFKPTNTLQWQFGSQLPNLIPGSISGYKVL